MESEEKMLNLLVPQVTISGFGESTTAKELTDYLENEVGLIWRCRLKTSWTPPGSYPNFEITDTSSIPKFDCYERVVPHAFVHCEHLKSLMDAAEQSKLILGGQSLKITLGSENTYTLNKRRRKTIPYKFIGVSLEIGTVSQDNFFNSWRAEGVDFVVDPFDNTCKFCFIKSTAFSFKNTLMHAVKNCEYKLELLISDIQRVEEGRTLVGYVLLFELASPPSVWYRTADDDIYDTAVVDLLDDDDPWIRTTDFTQDGTIGRCLGYRVFISSRYEDKLKEVLHYLKTQGLACISRDLHAWKPVHVKFAMTTDINMVKKLKALFRCKDDLLGCRDQVQLVLQEKRK